MTPATPSPKCPYCGASCAAHYCPNCGNHYAPEGAVVYDVIRFFQRPGIAREVVASGLTLEQAQEHCQDPSTSSATCTDETGQARTRLYGDWFDGYSKEGA